MKRLHVQVAVDDLAQSVRFYSTLFAVEPTVEKPDYAKWMLDDPRVNFSIAQRGAATGVDHLGIQVETADELHEVYARLRDAGRPVLEEGATACCYAQSEKSWITDPQGVAWEAFLTTGESTTYGGDSDLEAIGKGVCCTAETPQGVCCTAETPQGVCCAPKPELAADAPCCAA